MADEGAADLDAAVVAVGGLVAGDGAPGRGVEVEPHLLGEELVQSVLHIIEGYRDRVIDSAILPHTTWKAGELEGDVPARQPVE